MTSVSIPTGFRTVCYMHTATVPMSPVNSTMNKL